MLKQAKISIIIPVRNAASYLPACLESALGQSLQDIEVICIDDGSTDGSRDVIEEYLHSDRRLGLVCQSHNGAGVARNRGLDIASGKYIGFLDADDMYPSSDTLSEMVTAAQLSQAAVCGGELIVLRGQVRTPAQVNTGPFEVPKLANMLVDYRKFQVDYGFQMFIYERELIVRSRIRFPHYIRFQDPPFFVAIMHAAQKFMSLSIPSYCHRRGHRTIEWSDSQTVDLIRGIRDNLLFSRLHAFERVHAISAWRLREEYASIIQKACNEGSTSVRHVFEEAEQAIIPELIENAIAQQLRK
jgi:glycosyltransferase involved in cell wall biosynthesis